MEEVNISSMGNIFTPVDVAADDRWEHEIKVTGRPPAAPVGGELHFFTLWVGAGRKIGPYPSGINQVRVGAGCNQVHENKSKLLRLFSSNPHRK